MHEERKFNAKILLSICIRYRDVDVHRHGATNCHRVLTKCSRPPKSAAWVASTTFTRMMPAAACTSRAAPCRETTHPGPGHCLQSRYPRAGRRDSEYQGERRGGRSEIRPRLRQQQAGLDVGHQDDDVDQDHRRRRGAARTAFSPTRSTSASTSSATRRRMPR